MTKELFRGKLAEAVGADGNNGKYCSESKAGNV
jgi:hypothetical protein